MQLKILTYKIILLSILIIFFSNCSITKKKITNHTETIVKDLIKRKKLKKSFLVQKSNSNGLEEILEDESNTFFDFWEYNSFQYSISLNDAKKIFNKKERPNFKKQLKNEIIWNENIHTKLLTEKKLNRLIDSALKNSKNAVIVFQISKVIYTVDEEIALIHYSYYITSSRYDTGSSGLLIYKRNGNKWEYLTELFHVFS